MKTVTVKNIIVQFDTTDNMPSTKDIKRILDGYNELLMESDSSAQFQMMNIDELTADDIIVEEMGGDNNGDNSDYVELSRPEDE